MKRMSGRSRASDRAHILRRAAAPMHQDRDRGGTGDVRAYRDPIIIGRQPMRRPGAEP
jgi:hypothetical protein